MTQKKAKHSKKQNIITILVLVICIIVMLVSGYQIIKWFGENKQNKNTSSKILESVKLENNEMLVDFKKLQEENSNTVGWLKVEGTNIEYPVVKTKDNTFYLTHSFDNSYNSAGWIFADYNNNFDGTDKNIVIYGHNRRDGSMFGTLKNILKEDWYSNENNRYICLVTENGNSQYEVFSVYKIKDEDYYITTKFSGNDEFGEFINTLKGRSIYDFGIDVKRSDKVLTLSTCADNNKYRVVLHAKKVN